MSYSPALILRPRPSRSLSEVYARIAEEILKTGEVPAGLQPLIHPDCQSPVHAESKLGALGTTGEEVFTPFLLNNAQKKIIQKVDTTTQTVVLAPPGTGKTDTVAALVTHLLAQGKRVLVTAYTARALRSTREELPESIRPLAVSVDGPGGDDMAELMDAVGLIVRAADDFDSGSHEKEISALTGKIDQLQKRRHELIRELTDLRSVEAEPREIAGYSGSKAELIRIHKVDSQRYGWVDEYVDPGNRLPGKFTVDKALNWLVQQRDVELGRDATVAITDGPAVLGLPDPQVIRGLTREMNRIANGMMAGVSSKVDSLSEKFLLLTHGEREELHGGIAAAQRQRKLIAHSSQPWAQQVFDQIQASGVGTWADNIDEFADALDEIQERVDALGRFPRIQVEGEPLTFLSQADTILDHVEKNGPLKTKPNGELKMGLGAPMVVKKCKSFLKSVRVGRVPISTADDVRAFIQDTTIGQEIRKWEEKWAAVLSPGSDSSLEGRLSRLHALLQRLGAILHAARINEELQKKTAGLQVPVVPWTEPHGSDDYRAALDLAALKNQLADIRRNIEKVRERLTELEHRFPEAHWISDLAAALQTEDVRAYEKAYQEGVRLSHSYKRLAELNDFSDVLRDISPRLVEEIESAPEKSIWEERLSRLGDALNWQGLGIMIREFTDVNVNSAQQRISQIEQRIRGASVDLVALRAWGAAVGPRRLNTASRTGLKNCIQQISRLGVKTSSAADDQQVPIQRALHQCRAAVPVWIMPISSVVDQLSIKENLFDVVVVDEASQSGLEASFLRYLAPTIVVIGDGHQVSPVTVGIDQQQIFDLEQQYLDGIKFADSWVDPTNSLFDDASLRCGGEITLREHHRCVPEIINFSNRIAYEPEKISLEPIRPVGVDRLAPFKIVHTRHGYQQGAGAFRTNPVEADALVEQIKKCLEDPAYDGLTFGVISLLGPAQAKLIQGKLLEVVDAGEAEKRQLMAGIAADFQGAERDVIFLSMVSAYDPDKRTASLTRAIHVQRFNVSVSCAKDQVWLVHSIGLDQLSNKEDMRYQLLDYAYGIARQGRKPLKVPSPVSDSERVEPFESLCEQHVFNQIAYRGFVVEPHKNMLGCSHGLVIQGAQGKIVVECDGDHWQGPVQYERDLARQRDLERWGWKFFRIREVEYYLDPSSALEGLWKLIEGQGITPWDEFKHEKGPDENIIILDGPGGESPTNISGVSLPDIRMQPLLQHPENPPVSPRVSVSGRSGLNRGIQSALMAEHEARGEEDLFTSLENREVSDSSGGEEVGDLPNGVDVREYEQFSGRTIPVKGANNQEIIDGVVQILEVEGPMVGGSLVQTYHRASGGTRVSRETRALVNRAIARAKRTGLLIEENPLGAGIQKDRTYRLPHQSSADIRELGPRGLGEVPPLELLALMEQVVDMDFSDEEIMRAVLEFHGLTKLTANVRKTLEPIVTLYRSRH